MDVKDGEVCIVELGHWALAFFSLTLTTNGLCTLLIAARIWRSMKIQKGIDSWTNRRSKLVLFVVSSGLALVYMAMPHVSLLQVIHSAAIYTIALATMIGTYVSKSNAQYIALDALPPIIGIVVG